MRFFLDALRETSGIAAVAGWVLAGIAAILAVFIIAVW